MTQLQRLVKAARENGWKRDMDAPQGCERFNKDEKSIFITFSAIVGKIYSASIFPENTHTDSFLETLRWLRK